VRSQEREILDDPDVPEHLARQAYSELTRFHRYLGNTACIIDAIRTDPLPVHRVMDIGCASGGVLREIRKALSVEAIGVDLVPRGPGVIRANAIRDPLPHVDVAFSMFLAHHLTEQELAGTIRNVGRYARRFLILDLVRHPLPATLFRVMVAPFSSPVVVSDGVVSFRRAFTAAELAALTRRAVGPRGTFRHSVTPMRSRQVIDISYK
jgi:SAM-dependent methyltransferase